MSRAILLVPGWGDRSRSLRHIRSYLLRAGHAENAIHLLEFRARFGSNIEHADEIKAWIARQRGTGRTIDVVAHSMGGLAVRYLLHNFPVEASRIRRVISLGSPHAGTVVAWLGLGAGAREMRPASSFLNALSNASTAGVDLVSLRAPFDLRILPGTSSILSGARNYEIRCLGHRDLLRRRSVLERIRQLLEEP
jgi:triacylglycerol lipase